MLKVSGRRVGVRRESSRDSVEHGDGELVSFESPTIFHRDGTRIDSTSTLRFRSREAIERALAATGFELVDVRDAPDRPGREWVYLARRHVHGHTWAGDPDNFRAPGTVDRTWQGFRPPEEGV